MDMTLLYFILILLPTLLAWVTGALAFRALRSKQRLPWLACTCLLVIIQLIVFAFMIPTTK